MSIQQFELLHGAVLAKLVRSDQPISLRMIETKTEIWPVYTINDEVDLYIKASASPRELQREKGGYSWQFVFTPEQINLIRKLCNTKLVAIALVCGSDCLKDEMQIAFVEPGLVGELIDFSADKTQSLTVKYLPRRKLRIITDYTVEKKVSQNALENWVVPGS